MTAWLRSAMLSVRGVARTSRFKAAFEDAVEEAQLLSSSPLLMKCAQIIGVTVSETMADMTIAKVSVSANSCNSRPTMPRHE